MTGDPLTRAQLKTLEALAENGGELPEKRVTGAAGIGGPQGTQAILRTLMDRGLVERSKLVQSRPTDSYYSYRLTPAGREAVT